MPVISTFGALSSRGFGGVGGKPTSFTYNYMGIPISGLLYDFVTDSTGNYIGIFETGGITSIIKYNPFGQLLLSKRLIGTLIPTTYIYTTCLTIDVDDNVYLGGNDSQVVKLNSSFTTVWANSYSNISGAITSISIGTNSAGTSYRIYASNGSKLLSLQTDGTVDNIIDGAGAQGASILVWQRGNPLQDYNGSVIYGGGGFNYTVTPYGPWLWEPGAENKIATYNLSSSLFPFTFTDGIYTFSVTSISSITTDSTISPYGAPNLGPFPGPSGFNYQYGGGFDIMYSFTAVWVSGGSAQPTRYYVGIRGHNFITVIGQLLGFGNPPINLFATWYYTNIAEKPVNLACTTPSVPPEYPQSPRKYGCYKSNGSTVIFKYDPSTDTLAWCNKLTPNSGDGFETNRIRVAGSGLNVKVYVEGTDGFFVLPEDGSIPGDGNYTVNGVNYSYTTVSGITPLTGPFLPSPIVTKPSIVTGSSTKSIATATPEDYIPPIVIGSLL